MIIHQLSLIFVVILVALVASKSNAKTITFGGYDWNVKAGSALGPGPNNWCDDRECVWVNDTGLYLTTSPRGSSEIITKQSNYYKTTRVVIAGDFRALDVNTVVSVSIFSESANVEFGLGFSAWGGFDGKKTRAFATFISDTYQPPDLHEIPPEYQIYTLVFEFAVNATRQRIFTDGHALVDLQTSTHLTPLFTSTSELHCGVWQYRGAKPSNYTTLHILHVSKSPNEKK